METTITPVPFNPEILKQESATHPIATAQPDETIPNFEGEAVGIMNGHNVIFKAKGLKRVREGKTGFQYPSFSENLPDNHEDVLAYFTAIYGPERLANILRAHADEEAQYNWKFIAKGDFQRFMAAMNSAKRLEKENPVKLMKEALEISKEVHKVHAQSKIERAAGNITKADELLAQARELNATAKAKQARAAELSLMNDQELN